MVPGERHDTGGRKPHRRAHHQAAEAGDEEDHDPATKAHRLAGRDSAEEDGEERDGRRVVEEAFALDDPGEPAGRADIAEDRQHRERVGGGDDGAEKQADEQRLDAQRGERESHRERRHADRDHGEEHYRPGIVHHAAGVDPERRIEKERWQQEEGQRFGRERQVLEECRDGGEDRHLAERCDGAQEDAECREHDGLRQRQACCNRLHQSDEDEHQRDGSDDEGERRHGLQTGWPVRADRSALDGIKCRFCASEDMGAEDMGAEDMGALAWIMSGPPLRIHRERAPVRKREVRPRFQAARTSRFAALPVVVSGGAIAGGGAWEAGPIG